MTLKNDEVPDRLDTTIRSNEVDLTHVPTEVLEAALTILERQSEEYDHS